MLFALWTLIWSIVHIEDVHKKVEDDGHEGTDAFLEAFAVTGFSMFLGLYCFLIFILVAGLLGFHVYLILNGMTTHEMLKGAFKNRVGNPYNRGKWGNCVDFFTY